ncbi:MAG TPA: hypothetical protein VFT65_20495 [Candidatus Angelobacter sp.]|nr:hypothetical protein [Candidatus Angelobacter sp.]
MTKEEIREAIQTCARTLGRNANKGELRQMAGVSERSLYKHFGSLRAALESAGLLAAGPGFGQPEEALLLDWAGVARKMKKIPSVLEYRRLGQFSHKPFHTRYDSWAAIPGAFRKFVEKQGVQGRWRDVLKLAAAGRTKPPAVKGRARARSRRCGMLMDRPVYGRRLLMPEMAYEPLNELGVVFAFGAMARRLGFVVHRLQPGFPDCIAMRDMGRGRWQLVRIEFEYESRNFQKHRHRHDRCDLIVCWRHNWKDCPKGLEVLELSSLAAQTA